MIFYLAGLQNLPSDVYEAAKMEGAKPFYTFRRIKLYVTFESGANKYRFTTTYVIDRMLKIDLAAWAGLPPHVEMLLEEDEAAPAEREGPLGEMVEPARETGDPLEHLSRDEVE